LRALRDGIEATIFADEEGVAGPIVAAGDHVVTVHTRPSFETVVRLRPIADPTQALTFDGPRMPVLGLAYAGGELISAVKKGTGSLLVLSLDAASYRTIVDTDSP